MRNFPLKGALPKSIVVEKERKEGGGGGGGGGLGACGCVFWCGRGFITDFHMKITRTKAEKGCMH